jgi:hypothetical protein
MRITRRELAALLTGTPAAARAAGMALQAPPQPAESPGPGPQAAAENVRHNVAAIRQLQVPFETEPAFVFRAQ